MSGPIKEAVLYSGGDPIIEILTNAKDFFTKQITVSYLLPIHYILHLSINYKGQNYKMEAHDNQVWHSVRGHLAPYYIQIITYQNCLQQS